MNVLKGLEPASVFRFFEEICGMEGFTDERTERVGTGFGISFF